MSDLSEIEQLERNWGLWRDTRNWDRLRSCYAPGAQVKTTWMVGSADDFVQASVKGSENPLAAQSLHAIGAVSAQIRGQKAVAETRMVLMLRANLQGTWVDVTAWGRFVDWLVLLDGRWCIWQRHPVHEKDRMDAVDTSAPLQLDAQKLAALPQAYRHLTYVQSVQGATITPDLVQHNSPEQAALYASSERWLG